MWIAWDTRTTLKVRALFSLWSFIAHPVSQFINDSHLSSLSLRTYRLRIRPRLLLWLRPCCMFSLCSHNRPFFSRRQSPSTTPLASLSLTSSTPPMPFPSSSPSPSPWTMPLQHSESGGNRAARVLGIAKSPTHSSIHACAVSLHGLIIIKPLHPTPTIVLSPILSESNISSKTKSQIEEQLHGSKRPCLDFSTG